MTSAGARGGRSRDRTQPPSFGYIALFSPFLIQKNSCKKKKNKTNTNTKPTQGMVSYVHSPSSRRGKIGVQGPLRLYGDCLKENWLNWGQRVWLSQQGTCFACMKPWVLFPAPYKLDLVVHAWDPNTGEVESGESKSSRLASAT